MPEIWLNYGTTDVVVDVRAENLGDEIRGARSAPLSTEQVAEKLGGLDLSKPTEIIVLNATPAVGEAIGAIHAVCESKSAPFPKVLAEKNLIGQARGLMPEGAEVSEFDDGEIRSNLAFLGEAELDGLFGYETVATRLLRRFGGERMRTAYVKRADDLPHAGTETPCMEEARSFASQFDVTAIEVVGRGAGIGDIAIGNPSETAGAASSMAKNAIQEQPEHRAVMVSPGNAFSSATLSRALHSLWSCAGIVSDGGIAVLFAECGAGIGSETLQSYVEDQMTIERTKRPPVYMDGMEDLLYLSGLRERIAVAVVSTLPEFYTKKLGIASLDSAKLALEHILSKGPRQKVAIVADGAHTRI